MTITCAISSTCGADVVEIDWVQKSASPIIRSGHYGGIVGSVWYHAGGASAVGIGQRTCQAYDFDSDTWLPMADMGKPRQVHGVVAYEGKVYAFGGISYWSTFYPHLEVYDPPSDS